MMRSNVCAFLNQVLWRISSEGNQLDGGNFLIGMCCFDLFFPQFSDIVYVLLGRQFIETIRSLWDLCKSNETQMVERK